MGEPETKDDPPDSLRPVVSVYVCAQTLSLVRGGGVLPPLVCVSGSVRHLKLGPLGTDDVVMRALALQGHTHHDNNHTQQGAAGKTADLAVLLSKGDTVPSPPNLKPLTLAFPWLVW